jgi:hypothetical protein
MSKKISLDDVLKDLQAQAEADWAVLDDAGNVIGGQSAAPSQALCHDATAKAQGASQA